MNNPNLNSTNLGNDTYFWMKYESLNLKLLKKYLPLNSNPDVLYFCKQSFEPHLLHKIFPCEGFFLGTFKDLFFYWTIFILHPSSRQASWCGDLPPGIGAQTRPFDLCQETVTGFNLINSFRCTQHLEISENNLLFFETPIQKDIINNCS